MGIEGRIGIVLHTRAGRVDEVSLASSRPVHASRVLHGKGVPSALETLPLLFSICGTAQACAGVRACEQAMGITPPEALERIRDSLVRLETVREHLWRILLDWSGFLGRSPQQAGMGGLLGEYRRLREGLSAGVRPFIPWAEGECPGTPSQLSAQPLEALLQRAVFGIPSTSWLAIDTPEGLARWAGEVGTDAAGVIREVLGRGWGAVGRCTIPPLPELTPELLDLRFEQEGFVERPEWELGPCETSSLTRAASPLLDALQTSHGNGLLVRMVARLTELAQLVQGLVVETAPRTVSGPGRSGIGQVEAARGRLLHRVTLEGDTITRYQILAPTEWNFHPQGVLARSLEGIEGPVDRLEPLARLLVNAIDPCVAYDLEIR